MLSDRASVELLHLHVVRLLATGREKGTYVVIRQKVGARVGRREVQARDVFDLGVLFARLGPARDGLDELRPLARAAIARVWEVDTDAFRGQVVAYLEPEHADALGSVQAWEALQLAVVTALEPFAGSP